MFLQVLAISDFFGSNGDSPNCNIACFPRRFSLAEANSLVGIYIFNQKRLFLQTICSRGHKPLCRLGALFHTIVPFYRRFRSAKKIKCFVGNRLGFRAFAKISYFPERPMCYRAFHNELHITPIRNNPPNNPHLLTRFSPPTGKTGVHITQVKNNPP